MLLALDRVSKIWLAGALGITVSLAIVLWYMLTVSTQTQLVEDSSVPIGGAYAMTTHTGERVTHETFLGKPTLYYFGFTFCPDVCPTQLVEISDAMDRARISKDEMNFVFVTIDPERDTPAVMSDYVAAFHPDLVGLTGSAEDVAIMAKAYRVFYQRVDRTDLPDAYTMEHSAFAYLMGPNGHYVSHFSHGATAEQMAGVLKSLL